jgi:uncharacterized protein YndB with AHSA1/START domain
MSQTGTDRIEKQTLIQATPARVWRALTDTQEFGTWFGVRLAGELVPGTSVHGQITTPGCEQMAFELEVESMEQEKLFSYRWCPYQRGPDSEKVTTLVEFRLEAVGEATQLSIVESGFDQLPPDCRAEAFRRNDGGWTMQVKNIEKHVATT